MQFDISLTNTMLMVIALCQLLMLTVSIQARLQGTIKESVHTLKLILLIKKQLKLTSNMVINVKSQQTLTHCLLNKCKFIYFNPFKKSKSGMGVIITEKVLTLITSRLFLVQKQNQ